MVVFYFVAFFDRICNFSKQKSRKSTERPLKNSKLSKKYNRTRKKGALTLKKDD